jgi:phage terminase large subunit-like protein
MCIEGNSGILSVLKRLALPYKYDKSPKLRITLNTGQIFYFEGADSADVGRGYNAAGLWADELAKWKYTWSAWYEGILPSLRAPLVGDHPRDGSVALTRGATFDNRSNLSPFVLAELERIYAGTTTGRQELLGELLEEIEGALWKRGQIEADRVPVAPPLKATVVGMDPAATGSADETGLIAVGRGGRDGHDYVLEDWSAQVSGHAAARRAWELFHHVDADWLIVEDNVAKMWLITVLTDAYKEMQKAGVFAPGGEPPIKRVHARVGKKLRAEPVSSRYEQHRSHHVGPFVQLEDQMVTWVPAETKDSPDRVDALVHASMHLQGAERRIVTAVVPGETPMVGVGSPY